MNEKSQFSIHWLIAVSRQLDVKFSFLASLRIIRQFSLINLSFNLKVAPRVGLTLDQLFLWAKTKWRCVV